MIKNNIITYVTTIGGALLVLAGLLGFVLPNLVGWHRSMALDLVHLVSGCLALHFGLKSTSLRAARTFCLTIGILYILAGTAGLVSVVPLGWGNFATQAVAHTAHLILGAGFFAAAIIQPLRPNFLVSR